MRFYCNICETNCTLCEISHYDLEFEKIHDLRALLKICGKKDASLLSLMEQCEFLNTAYIDTRYPVHWPTDYSKDKTQKMQDAADKVAQTVKELLHNNYYCLKRMNF